MKPNFGDGGSYLDLLCPRCSNQYIHQVEVEVYWRGEDSKTGIHCRSEDMKKPVVTKDQDNNPSPRRDGIRIKFWCEDCNASKDEHNEPVEYVYLTIIQHKGATMLEWE